MGVLVSESQTEASYAPASELAFEQTYYWRIDEVNGPTDYTVFKGEVWSFTTEPVAYAVENITATSNVNSAPGQGPEHLVDGSGLDGRPSFQRHRRYVGGAPQHGPNRHNSSSSSTASIS